MYKLVNLLVFSLFLVGCIHDSNEVTIVVDDCGPVARPELGVVFSSAPHGTGESYITAGMASQVCPKITEAKMIKGYIEDICLNYEPRHADECGTRNIFVITEIIAK